MDDWDKLKAELLKDPATRAAYEARRPAYELASKFIEIRTRLGISQRQLAARAHMTQPEIARLESAQVQPTWETVSRILGAVGAELDIKLRDDKGKLVRVAVKPSHPAMPRRPRKTPARGRTATVAQS
ncbi:MAG: helix-turn-helix domain-containing protein [Dehalococcoidia bacterium]